MRISFIGKFERLHDEEYIAQSFEMLGHMVDRVPDHEPLPRIWAQVVAFAPDFCIFTKFPREHHLSSGSIQNKDALQFISKLRGRGIKTVSWVFDLYWGYFRENLIHDRAHWRSDYVFTSDGGHEKEWQSVGINHHVLRQGIYRDECELYDIQAAAKECIIFVGSENGNNADRMRQIEFVQQKYPGYFKWWGKEDTNEVRGTELNRIFSRTKIVVGDSVYSPNYWSNRVVETLGRGGMLIHQDVPGLSTEYPHLVTYERGNMEMLRDRINYYLQNEGERLKKIHANFNWVRDNYTMEKKCAELIKVISSYV